MDICTYFSLVLISVMLVKEFWLKEKQGEQGELETCFRTECECNIVLQVLLHIRQVEQNNWF
jgi:hypothetical protein